MFTRDHMNTYRNPLLEAGRDTDLSRSDYVPFGGQRGCGWIRRRDPGMPRQRLLAESARGLGVQHDQDAAGATDGAGHGQGRGRVLERLAEHLGLGGSEGGDHQQTRRLHGA